MRRAPSREFRGAEDEDDEVVGRMGSVGILVDLFECVG